MVYIVREYRYIADGYVLEILDGYDRGWFVVSGGESFTYREGQALRPAGVAVGPQLPPLSCFASQTLRP